MALPPPPNRQSIAPLFAGLKLCIEKSVMNREELCKLLVEHGACVSDAPEEDAVHVLETFCGVCLPVPCNLLTHVLMALLGAF